MNIPANLRINAALPFPALVQANAPTTIAKQNGIWTLGFTVDAFATQSPLPSSYPTDYLLGWDSVTQSYFKISLSFLTTGIVPPASANFDTYGIAAASSLPASNQTLRINGYYNVGDGGGGMYYRVASQPTLIGRLRTTDRLLPNGTTDPTNGGWWALNVGNEINVLALGAKADNGVTDNSPIFTGAFAYYRNVYIPSAQGSNYRFNSTVAIPAAVVGGVVVGKTGVTIFGDGEASLITTTGGVSVFSLKEQGYYRTRLCDVMLQTQTNTSVPAIDMLPNAPTNIVGGMIFERVRLNGWAFGWSMANAQLCRWTSCEMSMNPVITGKVFDCNQTTDGQGCNANRVEYLVVTGIGGQVFAPPLPINGARSNNQWVFSKCDIQLSGGNIPFDLIGSNHAIEYCEFENGGRDAPLANLIRLRTNDFGSCDFCRIIGNIFVGQFTNAIRSESSGSQKNFNVVIASNTASSLGLLDFADGREFIFFANRGSITGDGAGYNTYFGNTSTTINAQMSSYLGFRASEGADLKQGVTTLVAGTKVVNNANVTATSRIFLTSQVDGGTPGFLRVSARTPGVSFTITSSNAGDTSTVAYEIFEPYP